MGATVQKKESVKIYPIPASHQISTILEISHTDQITIELYDVSMQLIQSHQLSLTAGKHDIPLDISTLSSGLYLLRVVSVDFQETLPVIVAQ